MLQCRIVIAFFDGVSDLIDCISMRTFRRPYCTWIKNLVPKKHDRTLEKSFPENSLMELNKLVGNLEVGDRLQDFRLLYLTRRERPKSEPHLRLKNSKRTSKCQSILFYSTQKPKLDRIGGKGDTLRFFIHCVANHQKEERKVKEIFFPKSLTMSKKTERGPYSISRYCMLRGKKKICFGPLHRANRYNGEFLKFCRTFGRTVLVSSMRIPDSGQNKLLK